MTTEKQYDITRHGIKTERTRKYKENAAEDTAEHVVSSKPKLANAA